MRRHHFASRTAEEMRRLSNLGHLVEGSLLATVGALAILGGLGVAAWASTAWPLLILLAGVALLVLIYALHPLSDWRTAIWRDPQQRQHTLIAAALAIAGASELLRRSSGWDLLGYVWPGALIFIGILFLTHAQHGQGPAVARATLLHRNLGSTVIAAGILRAAEVGTGAGIFAVLWPLALLAAAAQLVIYREPEGAFEADGGHGGHG